MHNFYFFKKTTTKKNKNKIKKEEEEEERGVAPHGLWRWPKTLFGLGWVHPP
jgi:hypothetical protein